jgi:hypothetical protein
MNDETKIDPKHSSVRSVLRIVGPTVAGIGLLLTLIGMVSFFTSFGSFRPPRYFWCAFLGLPLLGVGLAISKFAFLGVIARYVSGETAPVAKDTFNYLAEGSQEGVKTLATAVGEGLAAGRGRVEKADLCCRRCQHVNDADAKFCKNCGASLAE